MSANMDNTRPMRDFGEPFEPVIGDPCKHCGELPVMMDLTIPAHLSHTGADRRKLVSIDHCLAPLVAALNIGGCPTINCCCGHGERDGSILLKDYTGLIVKFPPLHAELTGSGT